MFYHMLWTIKYKPKNTNDICGNEEIISKIKKSIIELDNIIIFGDHGIGKNLTIECILKNDIINYDIYNINACSDRGIKVIRKDLVSFLKSKTINKKYVLVENIVNLNTGSQYGLCSLMEKYENTCFIYCINNFKCIIESIQSRCCFYKFNPICFSKLKTFMINILKMENVKYENDIFRIIYNYSKNDIRKYINILQSCSYNNIITINHVNTILKKTFIDIIKNIIIYTLENNIKKGMGEINILLSQGYNHRDIIKYIFDHCIDTELLTKDKRIKYLNHIGNSQIIIANGLYSNIQLHNLIIQLCNIE